MKEIQFSYLEKVPELNQPLTSIKGIGPKRAVLLSEKGVNSLLDLLLFMPVRYEDRTRIVSINKTQEGLAALVRGNIISGREEKFYSGGKGLFRIIIKEGSERLELLWFKYKKAFLKGLCLKDREIMAYGIIRKNKGTRQMIHPDVTIPDEKMGQQVPGLLPFYPFVKGVPMQVIRSAIREILDRYQKEIVDAIPVEITGRLGLPRLAEAIKGIHVPPEDSPVDKFCTFDTGYHQRITFEKFFYLMLNIFFRKNCRQRRSSPSFHISENTVDTVKKKFPFQLTGDQIRVIEEILNDLKRESPMNRLIQGDVGCGKTVVAAAAAYAAVVNHYQTAIMVPTQVLALQHYEYFSNLSGTMGFRVIVLTGALSGQDRNIAYEKIGNGDYNLVIGTHTLIQEDLFFKNLGLVVIDEQQRFGVRQRAMMDKKGANPHVLVMTGTPIPRTIALTAYADLDISVIREYPFGHLPVTTMLAYDNDKRKVFDAVREHISKGQQAIVICPVIDLSEGSGLKNALEMHEKLRKLFIPPVRTGLIHGRLPADQKDRIMDMFRKGQIDLLVGTTVIEVGIHAPGATIMVVEDPERFGLAQLHQLRGRVGRGVAGGLFILMLKKDLSEQAIVRLKLMAEIEDGFELAQKDLEMRGQGEITGIKQAGRRELDFIDICGEPELLNEAKREAERLIKSDPELVRPENHILKRIMSDFHLI